MRAFLISLGLAQLLLWGGASTARADRAEEIVTRLRAEGYQQVDVSRTWLGRLRILAEGPQGAREIVVDPRNGEVLRDYAAPPSAAEGQPTPPPGAGGTGANRPPPPGDRPDHPPGRPGPDRGAPDAR